MFLIGVVRLTAAIQEGASTSVLQDQEKAEQTKCFRFKVVSFLIDIGARKATDCGRQCRPAHLGTLDIWT